jgi:hypothetical protein
MGNVNGLRMLRSGMDPRHRGRPQKAKETTVFYGKVLIDLLGCICRMILMTVDYVCVSEV